MAEIKDDLSLAVEAMQRVFKAAGKVRPTSGTVECPKCKGRLYYVLKGPRAHRGVCDTADCLSWIG